MFVPFWSYSVIWHSSYHWEILILSTAWCNMTLRMFLIPHWSCFDALCSLGTNFLILRRRNPHPTWSSMLVSHWTQSLMSKASLLRGHFAHQCRIWVWFGQFVFLHDPHHSPLSPLSCLIYTRLKILRTYILMECKICDQVCTVSYWLHCQFWVDNHEYHMLFVCSIFLCMIIVDTNVT